MTSKGSHENKPQTAHDVDASEKVLQYVIEDLNSKIKLSSSKGSTTTGSGTSTPSSASGWSGSVGQMSPQHMPSVDPHVLDELEIHARGVADNFNLTMGHIQALLQRMSTLTLDNLKVQRAAVDSTCDSVDSAIKNMYTVVARCEEIGKSMEPVYELQSQIREIKRLLDFFEHQLATEK